MFVRALFLLICTAILPEIVLAQAPQRFPSQPVYTYHYDVKFVCGVQPSGKDLKLAKGVYGTAVNLWNPHGASLKVDLRLALTYPPEKLEAGEMHTLDSITLSSRTAAVVDCRAIQAMYFGYGFPASVIKGVLTLESLQPIEVTSVWTTATLSPHGLADLLTSIDVDHVAPYLMEAKLRDPAWNSTANPKDRLCAAPY